MKYQKTKPKIKICCVDHIFGRKFPKITSFLTITKGSDVITAEARGLVETGGDTQR